VTDLFASEFFVPVEFLNTDGIMEREVAPKRDLDAADDRGQHAGVVFADWLCTAGAKESEKGGLDAKRRR
jgi:hypothetical protein